MASCEAIARSELVPALDLDRLVSFLARPTAYHAIQDHRAAFAGR